VLDKNVDVAGCWQTSRNEFGQQSAAILSDRLAMVGSCPKFIRCNAAFCPAIGGKHLQGEPLCHYLRESVKVGGPERVRACLPTRLAEVVIKEAAYHRTSTGTLQRPLERASEQGSRMESMKRAAAFKVGERIPAPLASAPLPHEPIVLELSSDSAKRDYLCS